MYRSFIRAQISLQLIPTKNSISDWNLKSPPYDTTSWAQIGPASRTLRVSKVLLTIISVSTSCHSEAKRNSQFSQTINNQNELQWNWRDDDLPQSLLFNWITVCATKLIHELHELPIFIPTTSSSTQENESIVEKTVFRSTNAEEKFSCLPSNDQRMMNSTPICAPRRSWGSSVDRRAKICSSQWRWKGGQHDSKQREKVHWNFVSAPAKLSLQNCWQPWNVWRK